MRICLVGQACARTTAGAATRATDAATRRRRESDGMGILLIAAPVPRPRAELVDVDALDAAQVDAGGRRTVRSATLGIAFDAAHGTEAVMQLLLVEQVIALPGLAGNELEPALGRKGPHCAELGADRAVALQGLRRIDFDGVGDGAAMAA